MINKLHFSRSIYLFILLSMLAFSLVAEEEIQIESIDAKSISTLEDESLLMEGSVRIITNKFDLETSKAIYNRKTGELSLDGNVKLKGPKVSSDSSSLFLDLKKNTMELENSNFNYLNQSFGDAESIIIKTNGETIITSSSWNNCSIEDPDWSFSIKEVRLLEEKENVIIKGLTVKVKNIPVLYIPYARSAVGNERLSGFLTPSLKQGKDGTDISIPYYFNLAPNYDLEIGPRYIAKRGLGLSSDFRYLTNRTVGEVKGTIFKKDNEYTRETGDSSNKRWEATWKHRTNFSDNLMLNINYHDASDAYFFRDIGSDQYGSSRKNYLKKAFRVVWRNTNNRIDLRLKDYVKLNPFASEDYKTLPRIDTYSYYKINNMYGSLRTNFSEFELDDTGEVIKRSFINPRLGIKKSWDSSSVNLSVENTLVRYKFNGNNFSNSSPALELDYELFLYKSNEDKSSYLIPNLKYIYQDEERNSLTPLIDSRERALSYNSLFNKRLFSGYDRQTHSNKVIAGLRKVDTYSNNGLKNTLSIGQAFYFKEDDEENNKSNLIAEYKGTLGGFGFSTSLELNDSASQIDKAFISFGYSKEKGEMLEIRGIYDREVTFLETSSWIVSPTKIKQAELIMNWPISDSISLFGRFNKDFDINKSLDLSYGFEYSNCCLKVGLMKRKWIEEDYYSWANNYESPNLALQAGYMPSKERDSLLIFFEFKNLGRLGKDVNKIITSPSLD